MLTVENTTLVIFVEISKIDETFIVVAMLDVNQKYLEYVKNVVNV